MPLISNDAVIGVLGFIYAERMAFNRPQRLACSTIANLASQATSRAQLIAEQSVALNSIDKALLEPHLDTVPGLQIDGLYRPSTQITSAGGDWYDVIALTPERVLIVIGDVANHGAASVGEMARARATVHALATEEHPPHVIATRASNALRRLATTITTAVIAIYETESRMLTWTTAGHPYPLLLAANGQSQYLEETHGPPLGVLTGGSYRSNQRVLEPGDTLVVFTDGLVERRGESIDNGLDLLRSAASSALKHETAFTLRVYGMLAPTRMHVDDIAILAVTIID